MKNPNQKKPTMKKSGPSVKTLHLKPDPANPNRMTDEDKARMLKSLEEFGDLSGIVINQRTGLIVGGHQRADLLVKAALETAPVTPPEKDGTVARGFLLYAGKKYMVRVVDWPPAKAHAALLAANRFGRVGYDDPEVLKDLIEELDSGEMNLEITGYSQQDLEQLMTQFHVVPKIGGSIIKDDDIQKGKDNLSAFNASAKKVEVICPKCGHQFLVDKE